ncbi:Carbonic anhydrase 2 [Polystyrenella longa]|uniref:Carbonic anhydrase n=1 Tax=Polystyrenella longa TaxID=2528007 RepID=A0A518CHI2_9PLAN|nr:Carbonic anhydrase 2 [Polystyrenella longa]
MRVLKNIFQKNRDWAQSEIDRDPNFFKNLEAQQSPEILWIGCADSRVPANQIMGMAPGEVFVHRNIANVVVHSDFNCLSVLEYAVAVLKVKHVIVCGHYGCGGVKGAMQNNKLGLIDNWLRHIKDVRSKHEQLLSECADNESELDTLCELNVIEQVLNVCHTTIVQEAWENGQELAVHGWIYRLKDGILKDLGSCITHPDELSDIYRLAVDSTMLAGASGSSSQPTG